MHRHGDKVTSHRHSNKLTSQFLWRCSLLMITEHFCLLCGDLSKAELAVPTLGYDSGYVSYIINGRVVDVKTFFLKTAIILEAQQCSSIFTRVAYDQILLSDLNERPSCHENRL